MIASTCTGKKYFDLMVFRWGHSQSRASPFYLKIKMQGFHIKTSNVSEIYWFYKTRGSRGRGSESATVREKSRSLALARSQPRIF